MGIPAEVAISAESSESFRTQPVGADTKRAARAAFESAWQRGEQPRIEDYLRGVAEESRASLLRELLQLDAEHRRRAGHTPHRDDYAPRFRNFAAVVETVFPLFPATVAPAPVDPNVTQAFVAASESTSTQRALDECGRFRIVKAHARGGLGEVFVAEDGELHRSVALKRIRGQFVGDADSRSRFVREAEITGNLEHPGIVPIYGLGKDEDGLPYYAMRFIQGESLKETIDRFHEPKRMWKDAGEKQLELRNLLQRFIDVCNAMEYAHSRGIVHRDLKPANIMVGKYGETLVVDWGLAKPIGQSETHDAANISLVQLSGDSDSAPTQLGQAVGTPQYMSPEQAAGRHDELTGATDVYALGGVLYSILSGKPPIEGKTLGEVLQHVIQGKIAPLPATAPGPLASICRKAMATEPKGRYAGCRALAGDVEKWLADELVTAHRESFSERLRRWMRNHRAAVTGGAALAATAVAALVIGLIVVSAEQRETERQRQAADVARDREADQRKLAERKQAEADLARTKESEQRRLAEQKQREAETAREKEAAERKRADEQRDQAEWTAYLAHIQAADAEWDRNQVASALAHLDACQEKLRGWEHEYLQAKFARGYRTFFGPLVRSVDFSPDEKFYVTGDFNGLIKICDSQTGRVTSTLRGHIGNVNSVKFTPDGKQLVSVGQDKSVKLWDAIAGLEIRTFAEHASMVNGVDISRDGKRIASCGINAIKIWNLETGEKILAIDKPLGGVYGIAFSPDGGRVVCAGVTGIKVWDASTGEELSSLRGHTGIALCAAYSPDGKWIAGGGFDRTVRIWNAETFQERMTLRGHAAGVRCVTFTRDGERIVSGSDDRSLKVWDVTTGEDIFTLCGHTEMVMGLDIGSDGRRIISAGDKTIKVWDAVRGQGPLTLRGQAFDVKCIAFSKDGRRLAGGSGDMKQSLIIWDTASGLSLLTPQNSDKSIGIVHAVAFDSDARRIVSGDFYGIVRVRDAETGKELHTLRGHTGPVHCVAFSPDGKRIASGSQDKTVKLWDAESGSEVLTLPGHDGLVSGVAFTTDGRRLISGSFDKTLKIWDATDGREIKTIQARRGITSGWQVVALTLDGDRVMSNGDGNTLKVWDAVTGSELLALQGHTLAVRGAAFSPDGTRIVSGSDDQTIKLWDAATGAETLTIRGHGGSVQGVAFSPDGRRIASGGADGAIKIWDATPTVSVRQPAGPNKLGP